MQQCKPCYNLTGGVRIYHSTLTKYTCTDIYLLAHYIWAQLGLEPLRAWVYKSEWLHCSASTSHVLMSQMVFNILFCKVDRWFRPTLDFSWSDFFLFPPAWGFITHKRNHVPFFFQASIFFAMFSGNWRDIWLNYDYVMASQPTPANVPPPPRIKGFNSRPS